MFSSGGGLQFFHGGLSPQELIIPVIVVDPETDPEPQYKHRPRHVAGGRITTGVFAVTVSMTGDLFTRESRVRLQLVQRKQRVAAVVGGDGFDPETDTIDATVDAPESSRSRSRPTSCRIDSNTGGPRRRNRVRLGALDVDVAADVLVDDDLD